jgi:hypothetical protein
MERIVKYHHIGIPTEKSFNDEVHLDHLKMYVSEYDKNPYGIEWIRYEPDAPYPEMVKKIPHIAFEVDNLEEAIKEKKVIIPPNSPSPGILVAFIEEQGVPVELLQFDK